MKLIVTESDNGDSLTLPGEWSAESVDYDDDGNSITTYEIAPDCVEEMTRALENADGVISYKFYKSAASLAARALRAIPSETRAQTSRDNGKSPVKPGSNPRGRPRKVK